MKTFMLEITSELPAPLTEVWQKVSTMNGVNAELTPLVRMTAPEEMQRLPFTQVETGKTLLASWLLLFGILPFDRHRLRLNEVWEGGFREHSSSLVQRTWRHERTLVPTESGCTLTDRVQFEPRVPVLGYPLLPVIRFVFRHRHQRLRQWFA